MNKKGLSRKRTTAEFFLLFIGLWAGLIIIYLFIFDFTEFDFNIEEKPQQVFDSLFSLNAISLSIYTLALLSIVLITRFVLIIKGEKRKHNQIQ